MYSDFFAFIFFLIFSFPSHLDLVLHDGMGPSAKDHRNYGPTLTKAMMTARL